MKVKKKKLKEQELFKKLEAEKQFKFDQAIKSKEINKTFFFHCDIKRKG